MNAPICFEDLEIGDQWTSAARTITETDIVNFACFTGDFDPLHVDHEHAGRSPFGQPIAHGMLGLAWVAGLGSNSPRAATQAFVKLADWSFERPAYVGDTVHVQTEVVTKEVKSPRRGQVTWKRLLINQRGEVLQSGHFVTLVATTKGLKRRRDAAGERAPQPHTPTSAVREPSRKSETS